MMIMKKKKLFHADDLKEMSEDDMARALVIGLATMLAKSGTERTQLKTASSEGYASILQTVTRCLEGNQLKEELKLLKRRGAARYLKYATSDIRKEISGRRLGR